MAATPALRQALNRGISSGNLVDTKIILYSHKDSTGRVYRPKALYTNSRVLKSVPYFSDLLFGNFAESQTKDFKEPIDEDESAEDYGYISDSDLEDDGDDGYYWFKPHVKPVVHPANPFGIPGEEQAECGDYEEHVEKGKVVKIPDIAFVTFQAFLMYLYTGVIEFAPFGSEGRRRLRKAEISKSSDDKVPRPSPKSIYRLADKYDVPGLKTLALNHIRSELSKCDIVEESFGTFASRYDEARSLYIEQLAFAWMEDSSGETTRISVENKIDSFAEGDLDHATEVLAELWDLANKEGDVKAPSSIATPVAAPKSPAHWPSVNKALIKSLRKGVFFDRKYWARNFKTGKMFKPVYFSSIVMSDKARQLNKVVKYLESRDPFMSEPGGDSNVESDCDAPAPARINHTPAGGIRASGWGSWKTPEIQPPQPPQPQQSTSNVSGGWLKSLSTTEIATPPLEIMPRSIEPAPASWGTWGTALLAQVPHDPSPSPPLRPVTPPEPPTPVREKKKRKGKVSSRLTEKISTSTPAGPPEANWEPVSPPSGSNGPIDLVGVPTIEGDPFEASDEPLDTEEKEEKNRAVLVTGSFSAWKSLFFYRCTDKISFAPLKSQGIVTRSNYIRERTVATAPPPCSPKSIYLLADLLGITVLRDKALEDIKKKVTEQNVVGEAFSWVTSGQKEILEMECDSMASNFKGLRTNGSVKQKIRHMADGSSSHYAGALKLGFEKAFKNKRQANRVKLRCSYSGCTWYNNHITYADVGSSAYYCRLCQPRGWNHYLQCVGCGNNRTSTYTACQSCGKNFA